MKKVVCVLAAWTLSLVSIYAQKGYDDKDFKEGVFMKKMPDGKDLLFNNVKLYDSNKKLEAQSEAKYMDSLGNVTIFRPEDLVFYGIGKKSLVSVSILADDGSVRCVFARRVYRIEDDDLFLFRVYRTEKNWELYIGKYGEVLKPVKAADGTDHLSDILLKRNEEAGGDAELADYIPTISGSRYSISRAIRLIDRQNPNLIPKIRWGVGVGVDLNTPVVEKALVGSHTGTMQVHPAATVFADFRGSYGVTFHPELTFRRSTTMMTNIRITDVTNNYNFNYAYNRTAIELPLLFRYTPTSLKGKWLPFISAGVMVGFNVQDKCYDYFTNTTEGSKEDRNSSFNSVYEGNMVSASLVAGAGVEYRLSTKHSLFFDLRYCHQLGGGISSIKDKYNMKVNTVSLNVMVNL